jgi:hypothetical protein
MDDPRQLRHYIAYRTADRIDVDGRLNEPAWTAASWSEEFIDILGADAPSPHLSTRFKLLWDDEHLYVGALLEEPHLWATLTKRDAVIYRDNDFEVFFDPDGDTHRYGELEINALGTVWDLMLERPYRDGGPATTSWDITGLRSAVAADGTLNDPRDRDEGWSVELAIPWAGLAAILGTRAGRAPADGDLWRMNFSRVQWELEIDEHGYRKARDPASGDPLAEKNWVWSPQGAVNMHMPEMWGAVQFSDKVVGGGDATPVELPDREVRWLLRQVYYAQKDHRAATHRWATDLASLHRFGLSPEAMRQVTLRIDQAGWIASAPEASGTVWQIRQDGRIWEE